MDSIISTAQALITTYALRVAGVLVFLIAAWLVAGFLRARLTGRLLKSGFDPALSKFFGNLVRITIIALSLIAAMGVFGIETTGFAALLAGAGLAIGMALQGSLSNFAAGVLLLIFRPFKIDDVVSVAGQTGKVSDIDLFTTALDTPDNRRIIVPNGQILGAIIENITYHEKRRVDVSVGVAYDASIDKTREVLEGVAATMKQGDLDTQIALVNLGASSVDWQLRVWCKTEDFWDLKERLIRATKLALDEAGIGIPFPQMDVHVDKSA